MGCVVSQSNLILAKTDWKRNAQSIVFTFGAFDLLHPGHIRLLEQARALGDVLVVGVCSDAAARARHAREAQAGKRPRFPAIHPAKERAEILAGLAAVDYVVIFDSADPGELLKQLQPDIIVEGASEITTAPADQGNAARPIVIIPREPGYSIARLIERIQQLRA